MSLLLIDCNYLCHRARHTTGPLSYRGQPTGVIYGFLQQFFTLVQTVRPSRIAFIWDSKTSLRREHYSFYKQRRIKENHDPQEAQEAFQQFDLLREYILPKLGFNNVFMQEGYEADDIIAKICEDSTEPIVIATSDDDLLQLLELGVCIYNLGRREFYTYEDFVDDYRIDPQEWVEVKKIAGCSGDNVPGVQGVGEKTAVKYLLGELKPGSKKQQDIISNEGKQICKRNDWLVRLPLPGTEKPALQDNQFNSVALSNICKEYGFHKWLNDPTWIDDWDTLLNG